MSKVEQHSFPTSAHVEYAKREKAAQKSSVAPLVREASITPTGFNTVASSPIEANQEIGFLSPWSSFSPPPGDTFRVFREAPLASIEKKLRTLAETTENLPVFSDLSKTVGWIYALHGVIVALKTGMQKS